MRKLTQIKLIIVMILGTSGICTSGANAFLFSSSSTPSNPRIAHVVMDYNSGEIISAHNANEIRHPASLTKMMTLYILFDQISSGKVTFDTKLKISAAAAGQVPSKLGIPAGSFITVQDAILSVIIKSNNDIAYAIAENLAGSERAFVRLMNQKAKELGLANTNFVNSHGLHDPNQYTTAMDMAKMARFLMINHNAYYSLFSVTNFKWNKRYYNSTNNLLDYEGVDGIKTGYTNASGFNLVTSAAKNNVRIIAVTLGFNTSSGRDAYMREILDEGFILATEARIKSVRYKVKPQFVSDDNLTIDHQYISFDEKTIDISQQEKLVEVNYNNNTFSSHPYTIEKVPYLQKLEQSSTISINPDVRQSKRNANPTRINGGNYSIQIGAFSNYKSALNVSYNTVALSDIKPMANKSNVEIVRKSNLFMARITKLSKSDAYRACTIIRSKGQDCFVIG